jgi:Protein of unknown function (DUF2442)
MVTMKREGKVKIEVRGGDHLPVHFHITSPDSYLMVDLRTLEVIRGGVGNPSLNGPGRTRAPCLKCGGSSMSKDKMVRVGKPIPRISSVTAEDGLSVRITWQDGRSESIDLAPTILTFKAFRPLRNSPELFAKVDVEENGSGIRWNDEMDLASYTLERLADQQRVGVQPDSDNRTKALWATFQVVEAMACNGAPR